MEPIVLTSDWGYSTAFKITTAKVFSLDYFMSNWSIDNNIGGYCAWVTFLNNGQAKTKRLTTALIKKEFPEWINSDWYRSRVED